jgi:hypothetical protein
VYYLISPHWSRMGLFPPLATTISGAPNSAIAQALTLRLFDLRFSSSARIGAPRLKAFTLDNAEF